MKRKSVNSINPYKQKKEELQIPLASVMNMHDFSSAGAMEEELMNHEICVARIPNLLERGFTHNVALVFKDGEGDVYSLGLIQHHGQLKNTQENMDALQEQSTDVVPDGERTGSVPEVQGGEREAGSGLSEPTGESGKGPIKTKYSEPVEYASELDQEAETFRNRKST
jgi:hypothetical protein